MRPLNVEAIPPELKARPQWVAWREEVRNGKPTKIPVNVRTGGNAAVDENPMLQSLEGVSSISFFFDYKNANIMAELKVMSDDATKNKQIADFLNGLKSFGSMAAAEKPEIGELVNKIEITSAQDHVKISATIPEELIQKLQEKEQGEKQEEKEEY